MTEGVRQDVEPSSGGYSKDYWDNVFEQVSRRPLVKLALAVLALLYGSAIYAPLLANDRPFVIEAVDRKQYERDQKTVYPGRDAAQDARRAGRGVVPERSSRGRAGAVARRGDPGRARRTLASARDDAHVPGVGAPRAARGARGAGACGGRGTPGRRRRARGRAWHGCEGRREGAADGVPPRRPRQAGRTRGRARARRELPAARGDDLARGAVHVAVGARAHVAALEPALEPAPVRRRPRARPAGAAHQVGPGARELGARGRRVALRGRRRPGLRHRALQGGADQRRHRRLAGRLPAGRDGLRREQPRRALPRSHVARQQRDRRRGLLRARADATGGRRGDRRAPSRPAGHRPLRRARAETRPGATRSVPTRSAATSSCGFSMAAGSASRSGSCPPRCWS